MWILPRFPFRTKRDGGKPGNMAERNTNMARTKSLSRQIRLARATSGLSVAEVAENVGVSPVSIYYWESGRVRPRDRNLSILCKVLRLPVRETMAMTGR